ncbi:hypothetical protein RJ639_046717 [Escallonia herrerae]|uniref:Glycerol-3-phosphate acyltransferase RAM2/GPAT1-8 HAD-like domain-containing protein n=1 Tax=Escallonia herrerae TaxID=1293975 RepID=A0AA89AZ75_9ASTE|nr:hypothetical protein RJ639_046717 [Escallonia herrerae]
MAAMLITLKAIIYLSKFLLRSLNHMEDLQKNASSTNDSQSKLRKYASLNRTSEELLRSTIVFHVEGALLRSSSVFPYFMLVAFEAGGILRALVLLFLYPFVCLVSRELALKIMVFLCFFGIKKESFRIGTTVLPKFFLEDVGHEGFEVVMKCGKKVGVSDLPSIMVEGFLNEYLGVDAVIGRKMKVACGYFTGLMEAKTGSSVLNSGEKELDFHLIGFGCSGMFPHEHIFSHCKDVFLVNEAEKRKWKVLPRNKYPKPLIFHDGRLAFRPTSVDTLVMFLWLPLGLFLAIVRLIATISLPYKLSLPLLAFTGMRGRVSRSKLVASVETLPRSYRCSNGGKSSIEVANHVQTEIARALGFECTTLTRKDKYMILAGVEGTV